ncbi:MAG: hypothetical protein ACLTKI_04825 [Lachnospiraceae bacterium]
MSSKTKIVVLRMKEIIYTAIFIGLGILLVTLFLIMFRPKKEALESASDEIYTPGVYTASLVLGSQQVNVEVAVDADRINSVSLVPLSDSVTTMYPLMAPAMEDLAAQICEKQTTENLTYSNDSRYTSMALLNAIETALSKASLE